MKKSEKIILSLAVTSTFLLSSAAVVGSIFCTHALILLAPAIIPILAYGIYKLSKIVLLKKGKNYNK